MKDAITDAIMNRRWIHSDWPWRAIDKNGHDCYFKERPLKGDIVWLPAHRGGNFVTASRIRGRYENEEQWLAENWDKTVQHINEFNNNNK
jgi:hypothetical protein